MDIDSYITLPDGLDRYIRLFERYRQFIFDDNLRLYRYEDIVFDKKDWVADINDYLSLGLSRAVTDRIAARHDIIPDTEDPGAHIRQVKPGNYRKHLSDTTISALNQVFSTDLEFFGYSIGFFCDWI